MIGYKASIILCLISVLNLVSCTAYKSFDYSQIDYSGADGCQPFNIGHRLGGDLPGNTDNTLAAMYRVAEQQQHACFKYWEFDINQTSEELVLWHDIRLEGELLLRLSRSKLPPYTVSAEEFVTAFKTVRVTRPVVIDLKLIPDRALWPKLLQLARTIQLQHGVPVWFITSDLLVELYADLCPLLADEFDIRLYGGRGDFCHLVSASVE